MMKARLLLLSLLTMAVSLVVHAQTNDTEEIVSIVRTEYFYDTDPGYGKAIIINNVTEDENNLTLSVDGLSPGAHTLYVRSQASNGVWSATQAHPFFLLGPRADHVARAEYFFDNDPGYGKGHVIDNVVKGDNALPLSLAGLTMGTHTLFLRAQDESGVWSSVTSHPFFIVSAKSANLSCIEYFFDNDPGYGKATAIGGELKDSTTYALSLDNLAPGAHTLYLRAQDNYGRWSSTQKHSIYVLSNLPDVVAVEYFFDDNDPGEGLATAVPLPSVKTDPFAFEVNTEGLPAGEHHLMVRLQNNRGFWTLFDAATFTILLSMGDVNGDGSVNIADAVATVTHILGQPIEGNFYKDMADMNSDDEIDIFDVSMIVNVVLNGNVPAPFSKGVTRGNIENMPTEAVKLTAEANQIYLGIDQAQKYTAFQFDVSLPEGMSLVDVKLASGMTDHQVSFLKQGGNQYRVVGLSLTNTLLNAADGRLVELKVSNTAGAERVQISNVLFVTPAAKTITGIGECVNSSDTNNGDTYNLKGEKIGQSRQQLGKGIFIKNYKKVIMK